MIRTIWIESHGATRNQRAEIVGYLKPYLNSEDAGKRTKAQVAEKILNGQLKAFVMGDRGRPQNVPGSIIRDKLPRIKQTLSEGTLLERREILRLVGSERIILIMDDSFVAAFAACARGQRRAGSQ